VDVVEAVEIVSILPAGAEAGDEVIIAGTGLVQAGAPTAIIIEGEDVSAFIVAATPTAITLELPLAMAAGDVEVTVDVGNGAASDDATYAYGGEATEPANDDGSPTTLPFSHTGYFGYNDDYDYFVFTAPTTGNINLMLDWSDASKDLDFAVFNWNTGSFGTCAGGATSAKPEVDNSCAVTAGTEYGIYINDYSLSHDGDHTPVEYTATVSY
jgi:hypothetical protein